MPRYIFIYWKTLFYSCEAGIDLGVGAGAQGLDLPVLGTLYVTWEQPACHLLALSLNAS